MPWSALVRTAWRCSFQASADYRRLLVKIRIETSRVGILLLLIILLPILPEGRRCRVAPW